MKLILIKLFYLTILILNLKISFCWRSTGHMTVTKIAETLLKKKNKIEVIDLAKRINRMLIPLSHNLTNTLAEAASWPDDLKQFSLTTQDNWHFTDIPVWLDNKTLSFPSCTDCSLKIIPKLLKVVTWWTPELIKNIDFQFEKAWALRYLIHIIGDVHQPLHSASLMDKQQFPEGDYGGNLFFIKYKVNPPMPNVPSELKKLHEFLDYVGGSIPELKRPLSKPDKMTLKKLALEIIDENSKEPELPNIKSDEWILESAKIAQNDIYPKFKLNEVVPEKLRQDTIKILRRRIFQAGVRLSRVLEEMYTAYLVGENSIKGFLASPKAFLKNRVQNIINNIIKN